MCCLFRLAMDQNQTDSFVVASSEGTFTHLPKPNGLKEHAYLVPLPDAQIEIAARGVLCVCQPRMCMSMCLCLCVWCFVHGVPHGYAQPFRFVEESPVGGCSKRASMLVRGVSACFAWALQAVMDLGVSRSKEPPPQNMARLVVGFFLTTPAGFPPPQITLWGRCVRWVLAVGLCRAARPHGVGNLPLCGGFECGAQRLRASTSLGEARKWPRVI